MIAIQEALRDAQANFLQISETAMLDAEILLAHALNVPRSYLHTWPEKSLDTAQQQTFTKLMTQRIAGIPIAYIVGQQEFWSLPLKVTRDTLIPRPETELLVGLTLECLSDMSDIRIADLGTGSGAIALALAHERPQWQIHAVDHSPSALAIASYNAQQLQLSSVHFILSDWCDALPKNYYHAVVANPPYIRADDPHLKNLLYEPHQALVAGDDGLQAIHIIIQQAKDCLLPGGWLLLEHGYDQQSKVMELMKKAGYHFVKNHVDLSGQPRVTLARL